MGGGVISPVAQQKELMNGWPLFLPRQEFVVFSTLLFSSCVQWSHFNELFQVGRERAPDDAAFL